MNTDVEGFSEAERLAFCLFSGGSSITEKYGRFYAQPFARGWGNDRGNALRRACSSSIEGADITAVRLSIESLHESIRFQPAWSRIATDIILTWNGAHQDQPTAKGRFSFKSQQGRGGYFAQLEEDADFAVSIRGVQSPPQRRRQAADRDRVKTDAVTRRQTDNYDEICPSATIPRGQRSFARLRRLTKQWKPLVFIGQMTTTKKLRLSVTNGAITPQDSIGLAWPNSVK